MQIAPHPVFWPLQPFSPSMYHLPGRKSVQASQQEAGSTSCRIFQAYRPILLRDRDPQLLRGHFHPSLSNRGTHPNPAVATYQKTTAAVAGNSAGTMLDVPYQSLTPIPLMLGKIFAVLFLSAKTTCAPFSFRFIFENQFILQKCSYP